MDWFFHPQTLFLLGLLVMLEIALSVDNLAGMRQYLVKLPEPRRAPTALIASLFGLFCRAMLVVFLLKAMALLDPFFAKTIFQSGRGVLLSLGGGFLIVKAIHDLRRHLRPDLYAKAIREAQKNPTIIDLILADALLSIDSVVAALAMANNLVLVIAAMIIAHVLLHTFWKPIDNFFIKRPSMMTITLVFLLVIGIVCLVRILGVVLAEETLITALVFALTVELLNGRTAQNPVARTDMLPVPAQPERKKITRRSVLTEDKLAVPQWTVTPPATPDAALDLFASRTCDTCLNSTLKSFEFCIVCGDLETAATRA